MGCVWSPVFIDSVVCIAMIGSQKDYITVSDCSGDYFLNAFVDASNCLANGIIDTCVPYHISIREVQDDHIFLLSIDGFYKFFSNFWCAHFRLKVVSGYLWRIYQNPVFILEWGFTTAIEEEGHVSIFFRLCYPELTFSCIHVRGASRVYSHWEVMTASGVLSSWDASEVNCFSAVKARSSRPNMASKLS